MKNFTIEYTKENEVDVILKFILELAEYEGILNEVTATKESLFKSIFIKKKVNVVFAKLNNVPIGFAVFFYNFSTITGKIGIYLEDFYIKEEHRGKRYGKKLFSFLANIAVKNSVERIEWRCLTWNQKSIDFYIGIGALPLNEWTVFRISDENLKLLANN